MQELITAIGNDSVDRIVAEAGTYDFDTSAMSCGSALCINRTLIIEGEVPGAVVLNATGKWRVFKIKPGGNATLIGLNITGGDTGTSTQVNFTRRNISSGRPTMEQNRARFSRQGSFAKSGGGIHIASDGHASLIYSNVYENKAEVNGGGIYVAEDGHASLIYSNVYENKAEINGGGLYINMGTAALSNVNVYKNRAKKVLGLSY